MADQHHSLSAFRQTAAVSYTHLLLAAGVRQEVADAYQSAGGAPYLDGQDTVFGQVYAGMGVVDAIGQVECDENGRPLEDITVNSITITTYGAAQASASSAPSDSTSAA